MDSEKFGKIFVSESLENEHNIQNNTDVTWKPIKFASFSNSDLLWYGFDGEVHPDYTKYKGFSFSLGFKLNIALDKNEENVRSFEGKIDTGLFVGDNQNSTSNKVENIQKFKSGNPTVVEILEDHHLDKLCNFIIEPQGLDKYPLLQYVLPCVLPREAGKKDADILKKLDLSYDQLKNVTNYLTKPLLELQHEAAHDNDSSSKTGNFNLMTLVSPVKLFSLRMTDINNLTSRLSLITMLTKGIKEEILKIGDHTSSDNVMAFVETVLQIFEYGCLENSNEFRKEMSNSSELKELQIYNEGYQVILEAVALASGICISSENGNNIRKSYLFQKFIFHFCKQMDIINEVFSVLPQSTLSLSRTPEELEEILKQKLTQANQNIKVLHSISTLLFKVHEGEDDEIKTNLVAYVKLAQRIICGFILWQAHHYHCGDSNGLLFDCYVYNNKETK